MMMPKLQQTKRLKRNPKHQPTHELIRLIKFARNIEKKSDIRKKVLAYVVIFGVIAAGIYAGFILLCINGSLNLSIPEEPTLQEPSGNTFLDAGETGYLNFIIRNNGNKACNIEIRIQPSFIDGLNFQNLRKIEKIPQNRDMNISIPITANQDVKARKVDLRIQLFGKIGLFGDKKSLTTKDFSLKIQP